MQSKTTSPADSGLHTQQALDDLIKNFEGLLVELERYKAELAAVNRTHTVRFGTFDTTIRSDLKRLQTLKGASEEKLSNAQSSSNYPFYEATWDAAKRSRGLVAFRKKFFWSEPPSGALDALDESKETRNVLVDIVTENGTEWIKVSSLTEKRLLHDIAKEGWAESDDESDEQDEQDEDSNSESSLLQSGIPIIRLAQDLMRASRTNRVRYQDPKVRLLLPRMFQTNPQISKVMDKIRATGCHLELGVANETPGIEESLPNLLAIDENYAELTSTLNIDTTVLLALVSDISHDMFDAESLKHPLQREHARLEQRDQLLPSILYPAVADRRLVCTREAVAQMRRITEPIANETEKKRTGIILTGDPNLTDQDRASARERFAALSGHTVPESLNIPVLIVDKDSPSTPAPGFAPDIAAKIAPKFAEHNASVFTYGWRTGYTTLTTNWTAVKHVEDAIERARLSPDREQSEEHVSGPAVWFIPLSRSLVGMDHGDRYYGQDRLELYKAQTASSRDEYKERRRRRSQGWIEKRKDRMNDGTEDDKQESDGEQR